MQYNRVFRTLAFALVFSLLAAIPATPALAATPAITLSPTSGTPGTTVTVTGTGFESHESATVHIFFNRIPTYKSATVDNGGFAATFTVPSGTATGSYVVSVQLTSTYESGSDLATASFAVIARQITLSPTTGYIGDTVTINGSGFAADSSITIYFDTTNVSSATTDANGSFTNKTFTIPSASGGSHTVKAQVSSSNYATATFTVAHKMTITPTSGAPGSTVTVNGSGFGASKPVTIKYNAVAVTTTPATLNTDATGSFAASFTVPAGVAGTYAVEVSDGTYSASANFTVTINITLSEITSEASPGHVGMEITMSGAGFTPNSQIKITYTTTPIVVATVTSNNEGAFSATFEIPKSEHGTHTITASDGTSTLQATFTMEQTAPATATLLLPPSGEEAESRAVFEWDNVTKDVNDADELSAPVTYDLQIASDAGFTSIVLEKTALTTSGYALLEGEELESTEKEAPYYWRIRAVDAASNAGDWTSSRTFYVGGSDWVLTCFIGAGVLLIFFLGFWAGRKSKRSEYY